MRPSVFMILVSSCLLAVAAASAAHRASGAEQSYLTADGRLAAPLELRDEQSGFAGVTGTIVRVQADGRYEIARFLNEQVEAPESQGQIKPDALRTLAETLQRQGFQALPEQIGQGSAVNAHRLILQFGGKKSTLMLPPGAEPKAAAGADGEPADRFATIVSTVQDLVGKRS
jgi:hypothetical protein